MSSTEDNLTKMKRETMALAKHPALNPRELWHLFVQQTSENLKANTEDILRERAHRERKTPNTTPKTKDAHLPQPNHREKNQRKTRRKTQQQRTKQQHNTPTKPHTNS